LIVSQIQTAAGADQHVVGVCAALASAASWAVGTMLFKGIGTEFSASAMTLIKSLLSMVLLAVVLIFVGWMPIPVSSLVFLILSGLIGIAAGDTCFFTALQRLQVHQLIVLMMLAPALTLIMAILFLGEMPSRIAWLGIVMVLTGVSLTLAADLRDVERPKGTFSGIVFGFLAILCMGSSVIIAKAGLGEIPALQATFLRMSAGFVGMLAIALAKRQTKASLEPLRRAGLQGRFLTAVTVVTFGGFWLSLLAVKRLDVSVANTLLATEPLFALPLSLLWLRERPMALAWSGAAIALPGALLLAFNA
jgi:drug/metabolite transporter (DMT)-like permease